MVDDANFPGSRFLEDIFKIWTTSLRDQRDILNGAWSQILTGKYGIEQMASVYGRLQKSQSSSLGQILRYPAATAVNENAPTWAHLDLTKRPITLSGLRRADVPTRPFTTALPQLSATPLACFSDTRSLQIKVDAVPPDRLTFSLETVMFSSKDKKGKSEAFISKPGHTEVNPTVKDDLLDRLQGEYIGMILDKTALSQPPLVIITVSI